MILTEHRIRVAGKEATSRRLGLFSESTVRFDASQQYDLFISHSFCDNELVSGLYELFQRAGYKVYIDWVNDKELDRYNVSTETASTIKKRIEASKGMAYISTSNSSYSRWCPWELGVADGMKDKVCIIPVMTGDFKGQEYLGLYPYLDYERNEKTKEYEFWITDQNNRNKYTSLSSWLEGRPLINH